MNAPQEAQRLVPPSGATEFTARTNAALLDVLPFNDVADFDRVKRGLLARWPADTILAEDGHVVWDFTAYDFMEGAQAPPTVNPSLWRQAYLLTRPGLFQVCEGVYQVRGFDVSNITWITTDNGWLVMDPMECTEVSAAAYELVTSTLGYRPVVAVIYTHPHPDHYAGVGGVVTEEDYTSGRVQIIAGAGFIEAVAAEGVMTANAIARRSLYYQGMLVPKGPEGCMTSGLGAPIAAGTTCLYAPTDLISKTGETRTVDGRVVEFQVPRDTEAPVELNFYLPAGRALCMAENAGASLHNILTLRGAVVRDAKAWADGLSESIELFAERSDVVFTAHFWPRWGNEEVSEFLSKHRDTYAYMHDQSVRLLNHGLTGSEIAEELALPESLDREWYNKGYYGSLSHNAKAIYQRYLGWYDGVPAHLWPHTPENAATRYVQAFGGAQATLVVGLNAFATGDYRWAAEVLNHLVFADPEDAAARLALADAYEQLGYSAENGTWRNIYLVGAFELRNGVPSGGRFSPFSASVATALTGAQIWDYIATRLNGPRASADDVTVRLTVNLTDEDSATQVDVRHGVLVHTARRVDQSPRPTVVTTTRAHLIDLVVSGAPLDQKLADGSVQISGTAQDLASILAYLDDFEMFFPVVTP